MGAKLTGGIVGAVLGMLIAWLFQLILITRLVFSDEGFRALFSIFGNYPDIIFFGIVGLLLGILIGYLVSRKDK